MDRTGADDDYQPFPVLTVEDSTDGLSSIHDEGGGVVGDGKRGLDRPWGGQCLDFYDVLIVDRSIHVPPFTLEVAQHSEMSTKSLHERAEPIKISGKTEPCSIILTGFAAL